MTKELNVRDFVLAVAREPLVVENFGTIGENQIRLEARTFEAGDVPQASPFGQPLVALGGRVASRVGCELEVSALLAFETLLHPLEGLRDQRKQFLALRLGVAAAIDRFKGRDHYRSFCVQVVLCLQRTYY